MELATLFMFIGAVIGTSLVIWSKYNFTVFLSV